MAIDYSGLSIPKPPPRKNVKAASRATVRTTDKLETAKAKVRAQDQCEVREGNVRCRRAAVEPHHLIGGIGRRNRGKSILALYKLMVCRKCHEDITGKILKPTTAEHTAYTVRYWRDRRER